MVEIERLRADHAAALFDFELGNRAYFAESITDRGDEYFADFDRRHAELLAEQEMGTCHFHLVMQGDEVVGRVNLVDVADGTAELGYRIAEKAAGKGLATAAVRQVSELAWNSYGLTRLRAGAAKANVGSRKVLERSGFVLVEEFGDQVRYELANPGNLA